MHSRSNGRIALYTCDVRGGEFDAQGGEFNVQGGEFNVQGGDFDVRGGDFDVRGGEFDVQGGEFNVRGGEFNARGGEFNARLANTLGGNQTRILYDGVYEKTSSPSFVSIRGTAKNCEYGNLIGTFPSETFHWLWNSGKKIRFGSRSGPGQILH
eukprot:4369064-Pyramimonas_sp.AAC.1